jgi:hypothetical protein
LSLTHHQQVVGGLLSLIFIIWPFHMRLSSA